MASIIRVGNKVRVQIRRAGHPTQTRTFDSEKQAAMWARQIEVDIDAGRKTGIHGKTGITISQAIDRYMSENPVMSISTKYIFGYLKDGLGHILIDKMTSEDIVSYIRSKNFGPVSGASHFSFLRSVLKMAKVAWRYHVPDVVNEAKDILSIHGLIGKSKQRNRRPTKTELDILLNYDYKDALPMKDIILFAIATAMRQAEITRISWNTFNEIEKTIVITDRKHPTKKKGNHQVVPLLDEAIEIIKRQKRSPGQEYIFPYSPNYLGQTFTKVCKENSITDLRFHDLRHEGASRLFEMGYKIEEVQLFTGHEDWKMLQRYTHLKAKDIRRLEPTKAEPAKAEAEAIVMDAATLEQFKMFQAMQAMMKAQGNAV